MPSVIELGDFISRGNYIIGIFYDTSHLNVMYFTVPLVNTAFSPQNITFSLYSRRFRQLCMFRPADMYQASGKYHSFFLFGLELYSDFNMKVNMSKSLKQIRKEIFDEVVDRGGWVFFMMDAFTWSCVVYILLIVAKYGTLDARSAGL